MITIFIHDQLWKSIVNETFHMISCMNSVDHEVMISGLKKKRSYEQLWTCSTCPLSGENLGFCSEFIAMKDCWSYMISTDRWSYHDPYDKYKKLAKIDTHFSFIKTTKQEILHFVTPIWPIFCKQQNSNFFRKQMLPKSWSILIKGWMGPQ